MNKDIKQNEIYDLKYHIADYILPRLKAYKEKFDKGESPSSQSFEEEEKRLGRKLTFEESDLLWSKILAEMIFPFEYLSFPDKFDELDRDAIHQKNKKGLDLFAKYFEDLWI